MCLTLAASSTTSTPVMEAALASVAERDSRVIADPLPHRYGATDLGVADQVAFVKLPGVEADRAHQVPAAGRRVPVEQARQRWTAVARHPDGHPGHGQPYGLLG